ncbi:MAG: CHAT domain-containing protein, partial [Pseudomonadota bacterium]
LAITDSAQRRLLDDITDLKTELEANVAALDALRRQPERNLELEGALENKRTQVSRQIRDLEEAFTDDSYRSTELLGLAHVALLDVIGSSTSESLLAPHEALLVYSSLGGAYLINITTGTGISTTVAATDAVPDGVTPATIARLLEGLTLPKFVNAQGESDPEDLPPFDLGLANLLYDTLIGPVLPHLDGITELIIVADGPLQSLPFSVLVEQAAPDEDAEGEPIGPFERYRQSRFLVDRFAISVQPSVSSLRTLRAEIPRSQGDRPLLGFGDPLLKPGKADQGTIIRTANQVVENKPILVPMSGQVDAESLEDLGDLPQTKALLISIGETLGANPLDLRYGEYAEEVEIRFLAEQDRLKRYRTIVFATHALVSDEISAIDLKEPAIVMSLPAAPDGEERPWENDGLLRASDIIRMKLDADLVVLAACNTAKPDGTPGAEPLSGLAKAFLYAGARSLLVSHWQADAPSTARLVPTMLNYANDNDMTLAKALALAKRELRQSAQPKTAHYAHPAIWAPFSIVGNTKKQN